MRATYVLVSRMYVLTMYICIYLSYEVDRASFLIPHCWKGGQRFHVVTKKGETRTHRTMRSRATTRNEQQKTPNEGIEPSTTRLRVVRSTDWANSAAMGTCLTPTSIPFVDGRGCLEFIILPAVWISTQKEKGEVRSNLTAVLTARTDGCSSRREGI